MRQPIPYPDLARLCRHLREGDSFLQQLRCELGPPALSTLSAKVLIGPLADLDVPTAEATAEHLELDRATLVQLREVQWAHCDMLVASARSVVHEGALDPRARKKLTDGVPLGAAMEHLGRKRHSLKVEPQVSRPPAEPSTVIVQLTTRLDAGGVPAALLWETVYAPVLIGTHLPMARPA